MTMYKIGSRNFENIPIRTKIQSDFMGMMCDGDTLAIASTQGFDGLEKAAIKKISKDKKYREESPVLEYLLINPNIETIKVKGVEVICSTVYGAYSYHPNDFN